MKIITKYQVKLVKESANKYDFETLRITSPSKAVEIINSVYEANEQAEEIFGALALNTKNEVIGTFEIFRGGINGIVITPREIFKRLCVLNATSFIIFHNHPSGDPTPSRDDITTTKRIIEGGEIIGIDLLDHIIVADDQSYSLKEHGYF